MFELDEEMEVLDLSGQSIHDLSSLIDLVFAKMPSLKDLNLSNNNISSMPEELCRNHLPFLEKINLNGNLIPQEDDLFEQVVDSLSLIGANHPQQNGGLKELFINLTREDQVDFILRKLPKLVMLNGLSVDRNELYSSDGDGDGEGEADGDNGSMQEAQDNQEEEEQDG